MLADISKTLAEVFDKMPESEKKNQIKKVCPALCSEFTLHNRAYYSRCSRIRPDPDTEDALLEIQEADLSIIDKRNVSAEHQEFRRERSDLGVSLFSLAVTSGREVSFCSVPGLKSGFGFEHDQSARRWLGLT